MRLLCQRTVTAFTPNETNIDSIFGLYPMPTKRVCISAELLEYSNIPFRPKPSSEYRASFISLRTKSGLLKPSNPNQLWTSDMTYIWTREGWLYLAVILDVFGRRIVGYAMSHRINAALGCTSPSFCTHASYDCARTGLSL
ncbi:DDE-type integrase/transposase/recombinase [Sphingobacteriales bacterium CHB3]|nr:DDE-type integrase/transposase/recombinase [Sphingobacteriales bacterium CHB3]